MIDTLSFVIVLNVYRQKNRTQFPGLQSIWKLKIEHFGTFQNYFFPLSPEKSSLMFYLRSEHEIHFVAVEKGLNSKCLFGL